jgi:hypothetical protein
MKFLPPQLENQNGCYEFKKTGSFGFSVRKGGYGGCERPYAVRAIALTQPPYLSLSTANPGEPKNEQEM